MKFIVLEGLDGSGKSTQVELLKKYLKKSKIPFKYIHFPRSGEGIYGELVARFLRGDLGKIDEVNPYLVALIYAGDRYDASFMINTWIKDGYLVLTDRYVYSNIAFQCAKLSSVQERAELREWIKNLEFNYHDIPKPDLSIFLNVPFSFTHVNLTSNRTGCDRDYLNGKTDIHEADLDFQKQVLDVYLWQTNLEDDFVKLECHDPASHEILKPDMIFKKILDTFGEKEII